MAELNTDLLPPLFDQILVHYGDGVPRTNARAGLVQVLMNGIINVAANKERSGAPESGQVEPEPGKSADDSVALTTLDRLSGRDLSRAVLTEQLQIMSSLSGFVIEIALLLIEAEIDLRLRTTGSFELTGITFTNRSDERNISEWCQIVLRPTLQASRSDVTTIWNRIGPRRPEGLRVFVESLQLSATLRDAVPYSINVNRDLVEPLLPQKRSGEPIRLLHISDLHLCEDLIHPERVGTHTIGQPKHSLETMQALSETISRLSPKYELLVATGDLTGDGSRGAFESARQYIQSGPISGENKMRPAIFGFNVGRGRRVLLPGNHDRFRGELFPLQRLDGQFEEYFDTPRIYPYVVGFQSPSYKVNPLTLLLFVFDSSLPEPESIVDLRRVACGQIRSAEIGRMIDLSNDIHKNRKVKNLRGADIEFNPNNTIRIALLHHHPVLSSDAEQEELQWKSHRIRQLLRRPLSVFKSLNEALMKLDGAKLFLEGCFVAGIQLILFGHDHVPFQRTIISERKKDIEYPFGFTKQIRAFCSPSTLQKSKAGNGFYLFDFMDEDTFSVVLYRSASTRANLRTTFSPVTASSGEFKVSELRAEEKNAAYIL